MKKWMKTKGLYSRGRKRGYLNEKSRDSWGRLWWYENPATPITK
jgi:hypothetical protein